MALTKIFKKEEKAELKKPEKKILIKKKAATYGILKSPHITEKATDLTKKNQYVFNIWPRANKTEVRKAIESLYNVDVLKVMIAKIPRKKRRLARTIGWRKGYKKAIVRLKEGQKIEVLPR